MCISHITLTDLDSSFPGSLLKTTPPPPGYPWVSGGRYVTQEPRFNGLVLNHQLLKEPEPKNCSKRAKFDQKQPFLGSFLAVATLNSRPQAILKFQRPSCLDYRAHHGLPVKNRYLLISLATL